MPSCAIRSRSSITAPGRNSSETIISRIAWYARSASEAASKSEGWRTPTCPFASATEIHYSYLSSFPSAPIPARDGRTRVTTQQLPSSLEIAQRAVLRPVDELAAGLGLLPEEYELYGRHKAKVDLSVLDRLAGTPDAKLICVTAITPTKAGEGKTTTSVSLTQGLGHIGKEPVLCLREASVGPVFGIKGGAAGGGYAQVVPMEDLNLHLTGDIHAIGAANNLLAAMIDSHILHGNKLGIDPLSISWRRCVDINDRALRDIVVGLGGRANGYVRQTGFDITAGSEVMAIVAVASDLSDLRRRLGAITVAHTFEEGGAGAAALAEVVVAAAEEPSSFEYVYPLDASIEAKIDAIATRIYGADGISLLPSAREKVEQFTKLGLQDLPICMAKTHLSLSHDVALTNAPTGFTVTVRDIRAYTGAGWLVALCGDMQTMPGLSSTPAAFNVDIDGEGRTVGLF